MGFSAVVYFFQLMFLVFFWLNLRLFILERASNRRGFAAAAAAADAPPPPRGSSSSPSVVDTTGDDSQDVTETVGVRDEDDDLGAAPHQPLAWMHAASSASLQQLHQQNQHHRAASSLATSTEYEFGVVDNATYRRFSMCCVLTVASGSGEFVGPSVIHG